MGDDEPSFHRAASLFRKAKAPIDRFVDPRLLISEKRAIDGAETDIVEMAHEAILR